jgi:hypothetical protein
VELRGEVNMPPENETVIRVHHEWNGWRSVEVPLTGLRDVHWFQPTGAPHPLVHGFVDCTELPGGAIPHDCDVRSTPHALRVCVLKRHALSSVYDQLVRRADVLAVRGRPSVFNREAISDCV